MTWLLWTFITSAAEPPILVYNGPGACEEGCATAAAKVPTSMGFKVRYVGPQLIQGKLLDKAKIWIQPGGDAIEVTRNLSDVQRSLLHNWVSQGGKYLGFCAGAFLADTTVDNENTLPGLALIPGESYDYSSSLDPQVLPLNWLGKIRYLFFQEGASFRLTNTAAVETIATYENGAPAVIAFKFGAGQVILSGVHPEAPITWAKKTGLIDQDGSDLDLARSLFRRFLN